MSTNPISISELTNNPIEIKVCDKIYKVKRLALNEIFGQLESKLKSDYINETTQVANALSGPDKMAFLNERMKNIPKGDVIYKSALEYIQTFDGIFLLLKIGLNKLQEVSDDEIAFVIQAGLQNEAGFTQLMSHLMGSEVNATEPNTDKKK